MKYNLQPLKNINIVYFDNCNNCSKCCDGSAFIFAPLFLSDIKECFELFPVIFIRFGFSYKLVYLLSDGTPCRYLQNGRCTIYDCRPHACKTYPFTLFDKQLHLDFNCAGLGLQGEVIATQKRYSHKFFHPRFINWKQKHKNTQHFINAQRGFKKLGKVKGITLYKAVGESVHHQRMHQSLKQLRNFAGFAPCK